MFKVPTYDELEKKEKEFNNERKGYTSNLFLKRKLTDSNDSIEANSLISKKNTETIVEASSNKKTETIVEVSSGKNTGEDDDDDEDLLDFINQNKDLIEKPLKMTPKKGDNLEKDNQIESKKTETKTITIPSNNSTTHHMASGSLTVSSKQRGNLVLKHIKCVPWNYCDQLTPDYQMGKRTCGFYLSMKYHLLNPTYIHKRFKELGRAYEVRILLCLVDVKEPHHCIKELEKVSIHANFTMILCWSNEEVARYLETYKAYEFKSADVIMEKATTTTNNASSSSNSNPSSSDANFVNTLTDFLCQIKSVNKTDASTLRQTFGSVKQLSLASKDELNLCPGLGPLKVNRIYEIFRTPFLNNNSKKNSSKI